MSWFPLQFDRLHEAPKRNKADFGGRQQIIFQATGELAGPAAVPKAHKRQLRRNDRARGNGGSVPGQIFGRVWKLRF
jgi:hypothetical protein